MSSFRCPSCSKSYAVKNGRADGRYLCPRCKRPLVAAEAAPTPTALAPVKTPPKPVAPAVAGRPGRRERKERKRGGPWIAWAAALIIAAGGGDFFYNMMPPSRGPSQEKTTAAARQDFSSHGVPLTIEEPAGVERKADPVTSGVPLPQGSVSDPSQLALLDEKGRSVPCQFTSQCHWPDNSIKWVLLDFQADVPAKGKAGYKLEMKPSSSQPDKPVSVTDAGSSVVVSTGEFSFTVNTNAACLVESVNLNGKPVVAANRPGQVEMLNSDGKVYRASKPTKVVVEATGPVRATVLVSGEFTADDGSRIFDGKVSYDLRLTAYAGKPWVKLTFTLKNQGFYGYRNEGKPRQWLYFKSLKIDLPLSGDESTKWTATVNGKQEPLTGDGQATLVQWLKYPRVNARGQTEVIFPDEQEREKTVGADKSFKGPYFCLPVGTRQYGGPGKGEGWAVLAAASGLEVSAAIRRFWQNAPRGFHAEPGKLSLLLWPEGGFWPRSQEAHDAGTYQFEGGRHKTAEVLLCFGKEEPPPSDSFHAFDSPVLVPEMFDGKRG